MKIKILVSWIIVLLGTLFLGMVGSVAQSTGNLWVGEFSRSDPGSLLPEGWLPVEFGNIQRHTQYSTVKEGDRTVVKAISNSSASGLGRKIRIDLKEFPTIRWNWKITKILPKAVLNEKQGDDFPVRIYVTFEYDSDRLSLWDKVIYLAGRAIYGEDLPMAAISYVWATSAPKETIAPNPYTDRVQIIVVESGAKNLNKWLNETRNVLVDYQAAFGKEPSAVSSVAIMTDTDNTRDSVVAFYGDIWFERK